jgi:hypothetical protein
VKEGFCVVFINISIIIKIPSSIVVGDPVELSAKSEKLTPKQTVQEHVKLAVGV